MKKILLGLLLLTQFAFSQVNTSTTKSGKYLMNIPDLGVKKDSAVVWDGTSKLLKIVPISTIKTVTNLDYLATPTGGTVFSSSGNDASVPLATQVNAGLFSPADKTKLNGITSGATANSTDAQLRDRTTHSGTQAISTIANLQPALDGKVDKVTGKGLSTEDYTTAEKTKLTGIANGATANSTDTALRDRSTHTGTQAITTVIGLQAAIDAKLNLSLVGANNGVAPLDAGGKVPFANLPASLMIYKSMWNATTNSPTLSDGSGVVGWVYKVSVAGTINLGSGSITFLVGDFLIHNGTKWERSPGTDAVVSVNGQQGVVDLNTSHIPETANKRYQTDNQRTFNDATSSIQAQLNQKMTWGVPYGINFLMKFSNPAGTAVNSSVYSAADGKVGFGTSTPNYSHHIHNDTSTFTQYTNTATGEGMGVGFVIGLAANKDVLISNRENSNIIFYLNSAERVRIRSNGGLSVGTGTGSDGTAVTGINIYTDNVNKLNAGLKIYNSAAQKVYSFTAGKSGVSNDGFGLWNITDNTYPLWANINGTINIPNLAGSGNRLVQVNSIGDLYASTAVYLPQVSGTTTDAQTYGKTANGAQTMYSVTQPSFENIRYSNAFSGDLKSLAIDRTVLSNLNSSIPSSQAVKAYVDANGRPYKYYVALMSQSGTSAPTVTVLENTIGAIAWTRASTGGYLGTLQDVFKEGKTFLIITNSKNNASAGGGTVTINRTGLSNIEITTLSPSLVAIDSVLLDASVEIRIYP